MLLELIYIEKLATRAIFGGFIAEWGKSVQVHKLDNFDEGKWSVHHTALLVPKREMPKREGVVAHQPKPSTYKNVLQLNLYRSHSIADEFTCPYLCYINYPNRKLPTSIYANREHQKHLFAYVLGSRGCGWISSSPKWRTTSSDNIVRYMRPNSTR